jgi:hypothetical protein
MLKLFIDSLHSKDIFARFGSLLSEIQWLTYALQFAIRQR